jgi:hypothetical protein
MSRPEPVAVAPSALACRTNASISLLSERDATGLVSAVAGTVDFLSLMKTRCGVAERVASPP